MVKISGDIKKRELHNEAAYWQTALSIGLPAAMWRLPNQTDRHLLCTFAERPLRAKIDVEYLSAGFAVAPFDNPEGRNTYFLPADLHLTFDRNRNLITENLPSEQDQSWKDFQQQLSKNNVFQVAEGFKATVVDDTLSEKTRFISFVEKAIGEIKTGKFQKVVLSRRKNYTLSDNFSITTLFNRLCDAYPTAFISAVFLPHLNEVWLGASPEILVSQDEAGLFQTMALAGTQSAFSENGQLISEADAPWRQKEIEEQALVSRYIINCFKKVRVREYDETGPRTARAGNLLHLQTLFTVDTEAIVFPQLTSVMLDLLHPTSAVCGMPKAAATEFIRTTETHNRELYSGYLGPVNINQQTNLFVNLRTMKVKGFTATLYAGCGITADSSPEKEWLETEMKCKTIEEIFE